MKLFYLALAALVSIFSTTQALAMVVPNPLGSLIILGCLTLGAALLMLGIFILMWRIGRPNKTSLITANACMIIGAILLFFSYILTAIPLKSNYGSVRVDAVHVTAEVQDNSCLKLEFPKVAMQEAAPEGVTTLVLLISSSGTVDNAKLVHSSGSKALDNAAIAGIEKCKFITATVNGRPANWSWTALQYVWKRDAANASPMIPLPEDNDNQAKANFGLTTFPTIDDVEMPGIAT